MHKLNTVAVIQCTVDDLYKGNTNPDDYCITVLKNSNLFGDIILACPKIGNYMVFKELANHWGVNYYFGSDYNIAERLYFAAERCNADIVARILLKRFYIDLDIVKKMILQIENGSDYINLSSNINYEVAADVMSFSSLKKTVEILKNRDDNFQTSIYKFSPWRLIESENRFIIDNISNVNLWSKAKTSVVKTKLNNLFSNNENKVGIAIDNPSSRYKHVLQYVNTSDCLLDIACGKGGGTRLIAQNAKSVIGIDYNEDYIKDGSKNLPSNIDLLCGTDELLNNYSDYFEKIVSLHTLEHVSNDLLFLKRIYKSLKNGGRLIIEVPRLMPIPIGEPLWPFHEREYSHKTMLHLFELSGFLVEVIKGGNRGDYVNLEEAREVLFYVCKKQC